MTDDERPVTIDVFVTAGTMSADITADAGTSSNRGTEREVNHDGCGGTKSNRCESYPRSAL